MNLLKLWILSEPTVMSSEQTRGDVYCCNNELHCTRCNQTMSVELLKCRTYQETTTVLSKQAFTTTMLPTTNNPQTVDGECQYSANPTVTFHVFFLLLYASYNNDLQFPSDMWRWVLIPIIIEQIQLVISKLSDTVNTVLGATVGVLLVLLLVTVVALVNTCD